MSGKTMRRLALVATVLALVLGAERAQAGFVGGTVSANYYFPDTSTILYPSGNAVVGAGVEFDNVGGFGVGVSPSVDVSDTSILITFPAGWTFSSDPKTFDGFIIADALGAIQGITGASLAGTNIAGYDGTQVTFDADNVYVNFLGFGGFDPGAFVSVDVSFAPAAVPEPSTLAGCGIAFLALAGYRLRGRAKVA